MQLSCMTSSVINRTINSTINNILYDPCFSLVDHILYQLPYTFYILGNDKHTYNPHTNNVIVLNPDRYNFYDYRVFISHDIEKFTNPNHVGNIYHINSIIFIHHNKTYKKEDIHILNQQTEYKHKIFPDSILSTNMGSPNKSHILPLGIPTSIFTKSTDSSNRKLVAILDGGPLGQRIKNILTQNNLVCDTININSDMNIKVINHIFNQYKCIIDLSNYAHFNLICALASGSRGITLQNASITCPFIEQYPDINTLIQSIVHNKATDMDAVLNYIETNHNLDTFNSHMTNIIKQADQEVFLR